MDPTHLSADFRDFLTCLNAAGVEYLVVGGHAVAYYGYVRPTLGIIANKQASGRLKDQADIEELTINPSNVGGDKLE